MSQSHAQQGRFYRPRIPELSPFYKLVSDYFNEFEQVYPKRYGMRFGFWRPIIRNAIDKFMKCGDLKNGFARVRCPKCGEEFFVAFSCKQRGCCPSCDKKRALILGYRLRNEVLADVPHRQWVFTIPKRLRVYFRFTRSLLGDLCRLAYETVCEVMQREIDDEGCLPAMVGAVQTFGDLVHWHPHIHAIVAEGVFTTNGHFVSVPFLHLQLQRAEEIWRGKVFDLLFDKGLLDLDTIESMLAWKHSGFNIDTSVRIEAGDHDGMQRLVEYISRCPFSLARMIKLTDDDKVLYRASHANCTRYPMLGKEMDLRPGMRRNYQVFDPLDFLASVTQHIPNKGEHQIRYYGFYSNKSRGMRADKRKTANNDSMDEPLTEYQLKRRITWAALIKCVYEVDPLECPNCGGEMMIISFIEAKTQADVIKRILKHCGLWKHIAPRAPPIETKPPVSELEETQYDYTFFDSVCA
ncbi:transposase [Fibrobacterota bacterium]